MIGHVRREDPTLREAVPEVPDATDSETPQIEQDAPTVEPVASDLVAEIKASFGLNVTELASIVGASRQDVYAWLAGGVIDPADWERLLCIKRLAAAWVALAKLPGGGLLHPKGADRCTLLDLLCENPLEAAIRSHMKTLAGRLAQQRAETRHRLVRLAPLTAKDRYENMLAHTLPATDR